MTSTSGILRVRRCACLWPLVLLVLLLVVTRSHADEINGDETELSEHINIYGEALEPCSQDGMALTGYARTGYCVDLLNDEGSHHVCIDLSSLGGGNGNEASSQDFCTVTGQSLWCSATNMPCQADPSDYSCPVENWCVCQWAFSSYVELAGCESIQTVVCKSVNRQALLAYQFEASKSGAETKKYQNALDCLVEKCGLDVSLYSAAPP